MNSSSSGLAADSPERPKGWVRGGVAGGLPQDAPSVLTTNLKFQVRVYEMVSLRSSPADELFFQNPTTKNIGINTASNSI